jgi:hypothetical protein
MLCWFFHATFPDGTSAYSPVITDPNNKETGWIEVRDGKEHLMIHAKRVYESLAALR